MTEYLNVSAEGIEKINKGEKKYFVEYYGLI
jgi:hypothetical protein